MGCQRDDDDDDDDDVGSHNVVAVATDSTAGEEASWCCVRTAVPN